MEKEQPQKPETETEKIENDYNLTVKVKLIPEDLFDVYTEEDKAKQDLAGEGGMLLATMNKNMEVKLKKSDLPFLPDLLRYKFESLGDLDQVEEDERYAVVRAKLSLDLLQYSRESGAWRRNVEKGVQIGEDDPWGRGWECGQSGRYPGLC
jgi:hypothetical protein